MEKNLISDLANEFSTSKTQIRRIIEENNIVAINETKREHKYVAKEYSNQSREIIRAILNPEQKKTQIEQQDEISLDIIKILREDKLRLIKELEDLKQDKRDQEQRFFEEKKSFHSLIREEKKNTETLKIELKETSKKNVKWYNFLKK